MSPCVSVVMRHAILFAYSLYVSVAQRLSLQDSFLVSFSVLMALTSATMNEEIILSTSSRNTFSCLSSFLVLSSLPFVLLLLICTSLPLPLCHSRAPPLGCPVRIHSLLHILQRGREALSLCLGLFLSLFG
ncbi:hypothetical protein CSUI_002411 [Cystoisospora suis]|uniref:Transmembrane protein n=1 Tax=Cystoisospora suis TaxID=483139 RepID=A0A2C6L9M1_9APIC|nr:hypothetical protein CSUI_002411 [Cystoisospora suis]